MSYSNSLPPIPERSDLPRTVRNLIGYAATRFAGAGLHFGHGTDNARDEATFIVLHALDLPYNSADSVLDRTIAQGKAHAALNLIDERIEQRLPAAYLTGKAWFAGHDFYIDRRVLVPRSPLAELIGDRFQPWVGNQKIEHILEIGTGSGCIGLAIAMEFPGVQVIATDISRDALDVATINRMHYGLDEQVTFHCADLYPDFERRFDLIITNPPYVPNQQYAALPPEYLWEPRIALAAGDDGCAYLERILREAITHLNAGGLLVVEVGPIRDEVERRFPRAPFIWVELEHGGEGVFVIRKEELQEFS